MEKHSIIRPFSGEAKRLVGLCRKVGSVLHCKQHYHRTKKELNFWGTSTYKLTKSLVSLQKPSEVVYDILVNKVLDYHKPQRSIIVEQFKFYSRYRHSNESVTKFIAELQLLSEFCKFGNILDDMIRECPVCSINDYKIQQRLFMELNLHWQRQYNWLKCDAIGDLATLLWAG